MIDMTPVEAVLNANVVREFIMQGCIDPTCVDIKHKNLTKDSFSFNVYENMHPRFNGILIGKPYIDGDMIMKSVCGAFEFAAEELSLDIDGNISDYVNVEKVKPFVWEVTIKENE